jgi:hypothetical protein
MKVILATILVIINYNFIFNQWDYIYALSGYWLKKKHLKYYLLKTLENIRYFTNKYINMSYKTTTTVCFHFFISFNHIEFLKKKLHKFI